MSQNTAKHFSIQLQGVNHKCRILVFPVIRLYLERAFGGDTDVVWSWWVSDLETSCLACRDGMIIPSLKMGVERPAHLSCLCNSFTHWCYTVSALWWDTVTFPGALWCSILICSHDLLPPASSSVAMKLLTELGKWLQCSWAQMPGLSWWPE